MSRYEPLWRYVRNSGGDSLLLTFAQIGEITGFPLDHAFLTYKKERAAYGWRVEKLSLKGQTVLFTAGIAKN